MDLKDKIGRWQSNAYVYKSSKAFTSLKYLLGAEYEKCAYSFGVNGTSHKTIPPVSFFLDSYKKIINNINMLYKYNKIHYTFREYIPLKAMTYQTFQQIQIYQDRFFTGLTNLELFLRKKMAINVDVPHLLLK